MTTLESKRVTMALYAYENALDGATQATLRQRLAAMEAALLAAREVEQKEGGGDVVSGQAAG